MIIPNHATLLLMGTFCTFSPKVRDIEIMSGTSRGKLSYSMFGINFNFFVNSFHWDLSITLLKAIDKNKFAFSYALHALSLVGVIAYGLKHKVST